LECRESLARADNRPISVGIDPVSAFLLAFKISKFDSRLNCDGSVRLNRFEETSTDINAERTPNSVGMDPVSTLLLTCNPLSLVRRPICGGTVELSRFQERSRYARAERSPISDGMVPVSELLEKLKESRTDS
jgi:hypothetical protein